MVFLFLQHHKETGEAVLCGTIIILCLLTSFYLKIYKKSKMKTARQENRRAVYCWAVGVCLSLSYFIVAKALQGRSAYDGGKIVALLPLGSM